MFYHKTLNMALKAVIVVLLSIVGFYLLKRSPLLELIDLVHDRTVTALNSTYDYIVVGGGSAGAVVAARLSENPNITVLLLEAGGEDTASLAYHIPGFAFGVQYEDGLNWNYQIERPARAHEHRQDGDEEIWAAGRVLGGGSIVNYLQYARGSRRDYDSWAESGCDGWSYKDVLPYFRKSEDIQVDSLKTSEYHSTGGFLGVSDSAGFSDELFDSFINAGEELGYDHIDHNGARDIGFSSHYRVSKNGVRTSPVKNLLRPAMTRPNLHVAVNSLVTRVILKGKTAVGVELIKDNRKHTVYVNKEIILSAGSIESPKLLLLSGIGPKDHLQKMGIDVKADLPVGKQLNYHAFVNVWANTNDSRYSLTPPTFTDMLQYAISGTGLLASPAGVGVAFIREDGSKDGVPDYQIGIAPIKLPTSETKLPQLDTISQGPGVTFIMFLLHPKSQGSLTLRSRDPFDRPVLEGNYFKNDEDIRKITKGIRFIKKIIQTDSMKHLNLSMDVNRISLCDSHQSGPGGGSGQSGQGGHEFESDAYWACFIRNVVTGIHYTTTCKMGARSDPTAVVDPQLRVRDIQGLRVVDASIMPTVVSGNTNAAAIMIGEKGADLILKDLK